jgi:hypothetical protein
MFRAEKSVGIILGLILPMKFRFGVRLLSLLDARVLTSHRLHRHANTKVALML